jgi:superfamily II DNA or RNA helicase
VSVAAANVGSMARVELAGVDPSRLAGIVGSGSYARGVAYYIQGAVARLSWDSARSALTGNVHGSAGELYTTTAFFIQADGLPLQFEDGRCSCPVGFNCKHVVALILTGTGGRGVPPPRSGSRGLPALRPASEIAPPARPPAPGAGWPRGRPAPLRLVNDGSLEDDDLSLYGSESDDSDPYGLVARGLMLTGPRAADPEPDSVPSWERSLGSVIGRDARPGPLGEALVGIELTLAPAGRPAPGRPPSAGPQPLRLNARLVQPGKNGWVSGSLSWSRLGALRFQSGRDEQVALLQELYALYHARGAGQATYGYSSYGDEKFIDLTAFPSAHLWGLLDQARAAGLELVYPRKRGSVPAPGEAELCLDVTRADPSGPLTVTPLVRLVPPGGGPPPVGVSVRPLAFTGPDGHGVVYVEPAQAHGGDYTSWPFRLARLTTLVPRELQRLAVAQQSLEVPAAELDRFRAEFYPRLRGTATVISSDDSFAPPDISGPTLVLAAGYGDGHRVDVGWTWEYLVDGVARQVPLPVDPDDGYRDADAERDILADLGLPLGRFGQVVHHGLLAISPGRDGSDRMDRLILAQPARLTGLDTMRLTTELLPLLADQPGVRVDVTGSPADYRAADDTLSIDVSTREVAGESDWFDLSVMVTVAGHPVPFGELFLAVSAGQTHLLLPDGAYFSLDKPEFQALAALIEEARALADAPRGSLRISRFQAGLWEELADLGVVRSQAAAWEQTVAGLLALGAGSEAAPVSPPPELEAVLRPYQLDGFRWLAFLWQHRLGGILADDMGLGKTLQSLALIAHARAADPGAPPFLIVAPTSVVPGWVAEAARFTPGLTVTAVTDTTARRRRSLAEVTAGADVVVTSYTLLRIDADLYAELGWSALILDEAQFVKNHQSRIYQCARRLPAPVKLAITGTPMENNLMELWALLSVAAPGLFPQPGAFRDYYARPIEAGRQPELLRQLRRRIRPLMLRRTKELVAPELPAKQEQVLEVALHPRHRRIYQTYLQRERQKILGLLHDLNANRFTILRSLTLLRQLSLHAGLVDDADAGVPCAKLEALVDQLHDVAGGGHRALVFSQFTGFLHIVADRLAAEGLEYCYLDGSTRDRAAVLAQFRDGTAPVFLISLKAGGFGLNLTEADYCFLLDPWWNPATENQAIDRTHRIGQTRNVMVYRLISAGTIEDKVMALKERKAELFASVIDNGDAFGPALDADDIRGLIA